MTGFASLIGQNDVKSRLKIAVAKLPGHSFLFVGPKGIGRRAFAYEFSRALMCEKPTGIGGCGVCHSCVCFREGTHPDYKEITLNSKDKTIKTENVRKILINDIGMLPQISHRKVFFITADDMNEQSQNVILKTLEEPPEYAVIILTAKSLQNVLPTVLSRVVPVMFERYSIEQVLEIIKSKGFSDHKSNDFFARLSDGIPGAAIDLLKDDNLILLRNELIEILIKLPTFDHSDLMLDIFAFFDDNKTAAEELLLIMNAWFRDLVVHKTSAGYTNLINSDKIEDIKRFEDKYDIGVDRLLNCIQISEKARNALEMNAGFEICICNMLLLIRKELINA